jgi:hypothetical protein
MKVKRNATVKITIERSETVMKASKEWLRVTDNEDKRQYDYIEAVIPKVEKSLILEQSLSASKFDLAKVLKAINSL